MSGNVDPRRAEAKRIYLEKGWTQAAIAAHFNVSTRTMERWASADGWGGLKQSKVVQIGTAPKKPEQPHNPPPVSAGRSHDIDDREVVEGAIASLSAALASAEDVRALGGLAGGLVKLLEYRRRVSPPTAAELADQLLALDISPSEFVKELRAKWQLKA